MRRSRLILLLPLLGSAALGAGARALAGPPTSRATLLPRPARIENMVDRPAWPRARLNATCESCHADIAEEWRASLHRGAFTNGAFQRSLSREDPALRPFCQSCHAPEANPLVPPSALVGDMGVGCVTCHAPLGPILAAPGGTDSAPHALFRTAAFAGDGACAGCHEFAFPGSSGRAGLLMQSTITEHLTAADGRACASCHMPLTEGPRPHRSHHFPGGYDESMVKSALDIRAERAGPHRLRLTLTPVGVTHSMPTGDLFRRIAIEVSPAGGAGGPADVVYLARHFTRASGMRQTGDDRVRGGPKELDLDVPAGAVTVKVRYERVGHHRSPDERLAEVEGAVLLAELTVP